MDRRAFLAASAVAAAGLVHGANEARAADDATGATPSSGQRQLIELRAYHFASPAKREAFEQFLAKVAIPAWGRAGVRPVGAFKFLAKDNPELKPAAGVSETDLFVLLPHESAEAMLSLDDKLAADREFLEAGQDVLLAPKSDPAYTRYETSLLLGFERFGRVETPAKGDSRVLQLRRYESHSRERNRKKIAMFNEGGEIEIFKRCGMTAVFFGEALAGPLMPNLTYMLGFDDKAALTKAWDTFRADAEWNTLKNDPQYKDTTSQITNLVLRPVAGSQI